MPSICTKHGVAVSSTESYCTICDLRAEAEKLRAEVADLRADHIEWLCEVCRVIHPYQNGGGVAQPCPDCGSCMTPTSQGMRKIEQLTAELERLTKASIRGGAPTVNVVKEQIRAEKAEARVASLLTENLELATRCDELEAALGAACWNVQEPGDLPCVKRDDPPAPLCPACDGLAALPSRLGPPKDESCSGCGGTGWFVLDGTDLPCRRCNPDGDWRSVRTALSSTGKKEDE